jgi:ABC-type nitrate/sulfonate/bicarbonate transport system ATPase subunit
LPKTIGEHLGLVALNVPLISNLDVWRNIALIYQHNRQHNRQPKPQHDPPHNQQQQWPASQKQAQAFVMECLQRYGLEKIADKRNPQLSEEERFCVKVLRAAMVNQAVIVIDRPFTMLHYLKDTNFIYETLDKIEDLFTRCDILDYVQEKSRYGQLSPIMAPIME